MKQCGADILVLGTQWTQRITGNAFRISLQPDWQIDRGFFNNRQIMACTQILDFGEALSIDLTHVMCRDASVTWEAQKLHESQQIKRLNRVYDDSRRP